MSQVRTSNCRPDTDLAFIALHGTFGEDGQVQRILEERGIAYTGEESRKAKLAFDKIRSKEAFSEHDITTPLLAGRDRRPAADNSRPVRYQSAAAGLDGRRAHH